MGRTAVLEPTPAKGEWWIRLSWLWLFLLAPLLVFSNGRWQLAVAALAAPFFARLFLFSQTAVRGLLVLLLVQLGAYIVMWWEVIPVPGVLYYIIASTYGLCYLLPFVVDRLVSPRIAGFASTLVLPLSWYLVEILIQRFTPYGSWTSAGYTQMGHGLLIPLAAWFGVAGVAFAAIWAASVASWVVITKAPARSRILRTALWAGSMTILVWLANSPPAGHTRIMNPLRVAAITPPTTRALDQAVQAAMHTDVIDPGILTRIDGLAVELNEDLIERSRNAARAGARLVVWSETAGRILDSREQQLIIQGQELAREEGVYLFMGLGVWHPGGRPPLENKVVAITPSGEVAWQYHKARPIVGSEAPLLPPGHNELPTLDTPYGRVGLVICHDLDFADYVAQAGREEVDLLLAPSNDWPVIADLHAKMGVMRAVENGFWLLRPTSGGLSVIASPQGHVVQSEYDANLEGRVLAGQIPMLGTHTIYPYVRPHLPLVAMILLVALVILAWQDKHG